MPKIRRWFNVSHDINSDPEVWELTDKFGVVGLRLWLELLSIGDRNDGFLPEPSRSTLRQLSIKCNTTVTRTASVLGWCLTRSWIVCDPLPRLRNYAMYKPVREAKKHSGGSPPNPPNPPNLPIPPIVPKGDDTLFKEFWEWYPKKTAKGAALRAWMKAAKNIETATSIINAVKKQRSWPAWQKDQGKFIPHAATWLNRQQWLDEPGLFSKTKINPPPKPKPEPEMTAEEREINKARIAEIIKQAGGHGV